MAQATLRRETAELVRLADRDLTRLWRLIEGGENPEAVLRDILPALIIEYGTLGAAMAADWYDLERDKAEARGAFSAAPVEPGDRGTHALIGFALTTAVDDESLRTLILGGTQRRIADHARLTIASSAVEDPSAGGWVRVGTGACKSGWCDQYLDGEIRTVAYDFPAHDNCNCHAVPAWR